MNSRHYKKRLPKIQPVASVDNLRQRVDRLFSEAKTMVSERQLPLDSSFVQVDALATPYPISDVSEFLDFLVDATPAGDIYLFGGVLRDLAILGREGFNSDIDVVVEGDWRSIVSYLEMKNAAKNKFGGYRLKVGDWPIDIWNAKETWAIRNGLVSYEGIASLTNTTVLNWDAILMNWRTRKFIFRPKYLEEINDRVIDIVLRENPNPLGMLVRAFRHLSLKSALQITTSAARYLADQAKIYSFLEIRNAERGSYNNPVIDSQLYLFFHGIDTSTNDIIRHQFSVANALAPRQLSLHESAHINHD